MATTFAPIGFSQYSGTGSAPTYEQVTAQAAYNAGAMYKGDPIGRNTADGSVIPIASTAPVTAILAGIFVGCKYLSSSQGKTVWANYWGSADVASGNYVDVYMINDPNAQFLAQVGNSTTTGLGSQYIGFNCQFLYGTPTVVGGSGISGAYIDETQTPTTTATWPFKIVDIYRGPPGSVISDGSTVGAYNYLIVAFNNVETKTLTGQ